MEEEVNVSFEFNDEQISEAVKESGKTIPAEDELLKIHDNKLKSEGEYLVFFGIKVVKNYPAEQMTWLDKKGIKHIIDKDKKRTGGQVNMITSLARDLGLYNPSDENYIEYPEYSFQCSDLIQKLLKKSKELQN